jgi:hypothetical protein
MHLRLHACHAPQVSFFRPNLHFSVVEKVYHKKTRKRAGDDEEGGGGGGEDGEGEDGQGGADGQGEGRRSGAGVLGAPCERPEGAHAAHTCVHACV